MSIVEEEMQKYNALQAEERLRANAEHMAEMAKNIVITKPAVVVPSVDGSVQGVWKARAARWIKVLAEKQKKQN